MTKEAIPLLEVGKRRTTILNIEGGSAPALCQLHTSIVFGAKTLNLHHCSILPHLYSQKQKNKVLQFFARIYQLSLLSCPLYSFIFCFSTHSSKPMPVTVRGDLSCSEAALVETFGRNLVSNVGACDQICSGCSALRWKLENTLVCQRSGISLYSNCCQRGEVRLPEYYDNPCPDYIRSLLTSPDTRQFSY